jgi:hypothetical protein
VPVNHVRTILIVVETDASSLVFSCNMVWSDISCHGLSYEQCVFDEIEYLFVGVLSIGTLVPHTCARAVVAKPAARFDGGVIGG